MNELRITAFFTFLFFVTAPAAPAQARVRAKKDKADASPHWSITPVAGLNLSTTTVTDATQSVLQAQDSDQSMGLGYSLGLLVEVRLFSKWQFESGLIYSHQRVNESINNTGDEIVGDLDTTFNYLQMPIVARYSVLPFLSAGGGTYFARGNGSATTTAAVPNANLSNTTASFDSMGLSHGDFGLIFNARGTHPIAPGINALFDVRYLLGLVNLSTDNNPDDVAHLREIQLLGGVSFDL